jgi:methyl-accepting chemotaxis protein
MKLLNGSSEEIADIVRVIDEIAFQTNILALNTAVGAACAGQSGANFAAAADEVRKWAQQSTQAAQDTARLIEESIATSNVDSDMLHAVADSVGKIAGRPTRVRALMSEVHLSSPNKAVVSERSPTEGEQRASYSKSLLALADSLCNLSGGISTPQAMWEPAAGSLASMPLRAASPLRKDEAAS